MKILMLTQFYPPVIGGEERHVVNLSEALAARGHKVALGTMPHPAREKFEVNNGVEVHSLRGTMQRAPGLFTEIERPHVPPFPDPELVANLSQLVDRFKPDIVHAHNWIVHSFLPLKPFKQAGLVSSLHDYSLVCSIKTLMRNGEHCAGPAFTRCLPCASAHFGPLKGPVTAAAHFASRPVYRYLADHFIAVSTSVAEKSGIADGSVPYHVVPTFISDEASALSIEHDQRLDQLPPDGYILFVGELNKHKGLYDVLEAYQKLRNAPPLVLIGRPGPDTPSSLPPNVTKFESWPHATVMHAWNKCLFGLAPSKWLEPCATVVMEANAMGKPIITTNHGGFTELVENGVNGLRVPSGNVDALAGAMQALIDDKELRETLSRGALVHAERFKSKTVVPQIEAIYRDVLAKRAHKTFAVRVSRELDEGQRSGHA